MVHEQNANQKVREVLKNPAKISELIKTEDEKRALLEVLYKRIEPDPNVESLPDINNKRIMKLIKTYNFVKRHRLTL